MIGFYDYTVIMTYISVVSSMIGIFCAMTDRIATPDSYSCVLSGFFRTVRYV